jgi:hypothetical protein
MSEWQPIGDFVAECPLIRRFILSCALSGGGFFVALWGCCQFDDGKRLFGAFLFGCGLLLGGAGYLLLWLTFSMPATWGWYL